MSYYKWRDPYEYRQTQQFKNKNNFGIYVILLTMALLIIFA